MYTGSMIIPKFVNWEGWAWLQGLKVGNHKCWDTPKTCTFRWVSTKKC